MMREEAGYQRVNNEPDENIGPKEVNPKNLKGNYSFLIITSLALNIFILIVGLITFGITFNDNVLNWNKLDLINKYYISLFFSSLFLKLFFTIINIYLLFIKKNKYEKVFFIIWFLLLFLNLLNSILLSIMYIYLDYFVDSLVFYNFFNIVISFAIFIYFIIVLLSNRYKKNIFINYYF